MRRTASEVLRSLEARIARLEGRTKTAAAKKILNENGWDMPSSSEPREIKELGLGVAMFIPTFTFYELPKQRVAFDKKLEVFVTKESLEDVTESWLAEQGQRQYKYSASTITKYTMEVRGINRTVEIIISSSGEDPWASGKDGKLIHARAWKVKVSKIICKSFSTNGRLSDKTYNQSISINSMVERDNPKGAFNDAMIDLFNKIYDNIDKELEMAYGTEEEIALRKRQKAEFLRNERNQKALDPNISHIPVENIVKGFDYDSSEKLRKDAMKIWSDIESFYTDDEYSGFPMIDDRTNELAEDRFDEAFANNRVVSLKDTTGGRNYLLQGNRLMAIVSYSSGGSSSNPTFELLRIAPRLSL